MDVWPGWGTPNKPVCCFPWTCRYTLSWSWKSFLNSLVSNLMRFPPLSPRLPSRAPRSWKGYCVPDEEGLITEELYYIIGKGLCWGSSQLGTWLIVSSSFITAFNIDKQEESEKKAKREKVQSHAYGRGRQSHRFTFSSHTAHPEPFRLVLCIFFRSQ